MYVFHIFTANLSTSAALAELSRQLTVAPDYLLKSSLLTKRDDHLLKLHSAPSTLTENRLLAQLSVPCLKSSVTLMSAKQDKFDGTCVTSVSSSIPVGIKKPVPESRAIVKEHVVKRQSQDTRGTSVVGKVKPKPVKKVKLSVPEQTDNNDDVSSFELPEYQLTHEHLESEKVELFLAPEKELMVERLMQPVVDVPAIKVYYVDYYQPVCYMFRPRIN